MTEQSKIDESTQAGARVAENEVRLFFAALSRDAATLQVDWQEFVELFGTRPERIELLNSAASHTFGRLQSHLWEGLLLHVARITDPAKSPGKGDRTNLTIRALPELIVDPALRAEVQALVDTAVASAEFAKDPRNRRIAHRDLAVALDSAAVPVDLGNRARMDDAIAAIHAVTSRVNQHLTGFRLGREVVGVLGGATALLLVLREGVQVREARLDRMVSGRATPEDLQFSADV